MTWWVKKKICCLNKERNAKILKLIKKKNETKKLHFFLAGKKNSDMINKRSKETTENNLTL